MEKLKPDAPVTRTQAGHFLQEEVPDEIRAGAVRRIAERVSAGDWQSQPDNLDPPGNKIQKPAEIRLGMRKDGTVSDLTSLATMSEYATTLVRKLESPVAHHSETCP